MGLNTRVEIESRNWQQLYEAAGSREFPRAVGFVLNRAAKEAMQTFKKSMDATLTSENAFTRNALYIRSIDYGAVTDASTAMYGVKPIQSTYLKYAFGDGENLRLPGDVGLAQHYLLLPQWKGLTAIGIKPLKGGFLPRNATARAFALRNQKGPDGQPKAFWGIPNNNRFKGNTKAMGLWARSPRVVDKSKQQTINRRDGTRFTVNSVVNKGGIQPLFLAIEKATYKPALQKPWDDAIDKASVNVAKYFEEELLHKVFRKSNNRSF